MFDKKNTIHCSVITCEFNESKKCSAEHVEVTMNNAIMANRAAETACSTFRPKAY